MGWAIALLLLGAVLVGIVLLGRLPRRLLEAVGAALLLGLAGYAWQGHPDFPGSPRDAAQTAPEFDEDLAKLRDAFGGRYGKAAPWLTMSDGLARQGKTKESANVLIAGLRAAPDEPNLWVGLGNALVAHGNGIVSPAARYSYEQATRLAPKSSAAPYILGLALARSGEYAQAREVWGSLAEQVSPDTPLSAMLRADLAQIDSILAAPPATR